jgi:hypothetical protein
MQPPQDSSNTITKEIEEYCCNECVPRDQNVNHEVVAHNFYCILIFFLFSFFQLKKWVLFARSDAEKFQACLFPSPYAPTSSSVLRFFTCGLFRLT